MIDLSDINSDGTKIVGDGMNPYGKNEGWIAEIPSLLTETVTVPLDIEPQSCPNPINVKSKGVQWVAILGSDTLNVRDIDIETILLEGVAPIHLSYKDVAAPVTDEADCACKKSHSDGFMDLKMKFKTQQIVGALGQVEDGQEWLMQITGSLYDGTEIEGTDCIIIKKKGKKK